MCKRKNCCHIILYRWYALYFFKANIPLQSSIKYRFVWLHVGEMFHFQRFDSFTQISGYFLSVSFHFYSSIDSTNNLVTFLPYYYYYYYLLFIIYFYYQSSFIYLHFDSFILFIYPFSIPISIPFHSIPFLKWDLAPFSSLPSNTSV